MAACAQCGEVNPERARFCLACGAAVEAPPAAEVRKTVTVLFSDVTGSTALGERLDPEALRAMMLRYFDAMAAVIARHGGTVEKFIGDAVMAVFGVPRVHEDDALRAVRAASEMRSELERLNTALEAGYGVGLQIRTGVNTGEVVAGSSSDATMVSGDAVNLAARLEQAAPPGKIYIGPTTYELVRDAVDAERGDPLSLKGKAEPVRPWRLLRVRTTAHSGRARRFDTPFVGRTQELALLRWTFARVLRERSCHLVTLLGPAGIGKSRLVSEAIDAMSDRADVLVGRCLPYGEGITYWSLSEIVRRAAGITGTDDRAAVTAKLQSALDPHDPAAARVAAGVASLLGFTDAQRQCADGAWAVRKLLEGLARRRPLVVVFEDLHWAEPTLLDLVEHVAEWSRDAPLLLVAVARPELLDERSGWGGGQRNSTSLLLEPLTAEESSSLVDGLLGSGVDQDAASRVTAATAGNPLFLEEMLRMLVEEGLLQRKGDRWTGAADLGGIAMPPTVTALLSARLDRIDALERDVLGRAAVIGESFERGAVVELAPQAQRPTVPSRLLALVRKDLLRVGDEASVDDDVFAFRHLLVRDTVYGAMPKLVRADLHERFAGWLEDVDGVRNREYDELIAYHLERALQLRAELGIAGDGVRGLAERAARRLASGGRRALDRGDMPATVKLLGRATALLPPEDPQRAELLLHLGTALTETGEFDEAGAVLDEAVAGSAGFPAIQARARLGQLWLQSSLDLSGWAERAERQARDALAVFDALDDDQGKANAEAMLGEVYYLQGHIAASEAALQRAAASAERAGDALEAAQCYASLTHAMVDGPEPLEPAIARCEAIFAAADGNRSVEARALRALAQLRSLQGRHDEARRCLAGSVERFADLGQLYWLATTDWVAGQVERWAGDPAAAERAFRAGLRRFQRLGEGPYVSPVAAGLAALISRREPEQAQQLVELARRTAGHDDVESQVRLRIAESVLAVARGSASEALETAAQAVRLAEPTDALALRARAHSTLALAAAAAGADEVGAEAADRAGRLWALKGVVALPPPP